MRSARSGQKDYSKLFPNLSFLGKQSLYLIDTRRARHEEVELSCQICHYLTDRYSMRVDLWMSIEKPYYHTVRKDSNKVVFVIINR